MEDWPEDHHFQFHELKVEDIWMIADFGKVELGCSILIDFASKNIDQPHAAGRNSFYFMIGRLLFTSPLSLNTTFLTSIIITCTYF